MNATAREGRELTDAAAVHAAREGVVRALSPLAASPLDEQAAAQMRQALAKASAPRVREALRRLVATPQRPAQRPVLAAVPSTTGGGGGGRPAQATPASGPHQSTPGPDGGVA